MKFIYAPFLAAFLTVTSLESIKIPDGFGVNFYESMSWVKNNIPSLKVTPEWQLLEKKYNEHVINHLTYIEKRIPKIIHQIWIGSPFPEKYKKFQQSWIKHHPDWEYRLWTDKEIKAFNLKNKHIYDAASNFGAKSDIARYEILYRLGGLYVDTDFECLRPMDIFHHCFDFYTGSAYFPNCTAFMAIIGAVPYHPILKYCIETLDIKKISHPTCSMDILMSSGPGHFSKALNQHLRSSSDAAVAFPPGYFYPWPHYNRNENKQEQIKKFIRPESFAIHHWQASWDKSRIKFYDECYEYWN